MLDVIRQLKLSLCLPTRGHTFEIKWRKLPLNLVLEFEIQLGRGVRCPMPQRCPCLAWVMVAVVEKENDFAT
jgi:hypothetical protein